MAQGKAESGLVSNKLVVNYGNHSFAGDFPPYYILHMIVYYRSNVFSETVVVTHDVIENVSLSGR